MTFSIGSQDNNKKRSVVGGGSPASQQRKVRFRDTPTGSVSSQVLDPILENDYNRFPETTLQFQTSQQSRVTSLGSLLGGASTAGSYGDHDGTSVLSTTEPGGAELFATFFSRRQDLRGLVNSLCVEQRLVDLDDHDQSPDIEELIKEISENPRNSLIAQIGLTGIGEDEIDLRTLQARWLQAANACGVRIQESYIEERNLEPALFAARVALKKATEDHRNLSVNLNLVLATRATSEGHRHHHRRRSKIATILLAIMHALKAGRESEKVRILLQSSVGQ